MIRIGLCVSFVGTGLLSVACMMSTATAEPGDWSQWMGANRDAKVTGFVAPSRWPKELKKQWSTTIGNGVATPSLVGNRLYVFARQGDNEVTRCLDAETGKEIWQDKYAAESARGPSGGFPGPRSSPTVADGRVIVYGVSGKLSCLDAASGKVLWRNDEPESNSLPRFYTSSSPIVIAGLCIAQRGGEDNGSTVAYNLADGIPKWTWKGPGTAYASPMLLKVGGTDAVVMETDESIVALNAMDGKLLWETPYVVSGRGYNAATPIVDGQTMIITGSNRGAKAMAIEVDSSKLAAKELWSNSDSSVQYNTPVLKNGKLFGLSASDVLFCIDTKSGKTTWSAPVNEAAQAAPPPPADGGKGKQGGKGGRGGGGRAGYGSIVDAGAVLFTLTPAGELGVIEPNGEKLVRLAKYKVADGQTYAYPVIAGKRIYIKDGESVTLYTLE